MALRLVFEAGPDKGDSFVLVGVQEVRIGRGPGFHIVPHDDDWRGGLRVRCDRGVFKVSSDMEYTIFRAAPDAWVKYLKGDQTIWEEFRPREEVPWLHGAFFAPASNTILRGFVIDDPPGQVEPVVKEEPEAGSVVSGPLGWLLIASLFALAGFLLFMPSSSEAEKSPADTRREFAQAVRGLEAVAASEPARRRAAEGVLSQLREARRNELWRRSDAAFEGYLAARRDIERLIAATSPPGEESPLGPALGFVSDRVLALGSSGKLTKGGRR